MGGEKIAGSPSCLFPHIFLKRLAEYQNDENMSASSDSEKEPLYFERCLFSSTHALFWAVLLYLLDDIVHLDKRAIASSSHKKEKWKVSLTVSKWFLLLAVLQSAYKVVFPPQSYRLWCDSIFWFDVTVLKVLFTELKTLSGISVKKNMQVSFLMSVYVR